MLRPAWAVLAALAWALPVAGARGGELRLRNRVIDPVGLPRQAPGPPPSDGIEVLVAGRPIDASMRGEIADLGGQVAAYLPDDSLLVRLGPPARAATLALPWVRALVALEPSDKVSPRLSRSPSAAPDPAWRDLLLVQVFPGSDLAALTARLAAAGARVLSPPTAGTWPRLVVGMAGGDRRAAALKLAGLDDVVWVEPSEPVEWLNDSSIWVGQSWDAAGFSTPVFAHGLFGEGQVVAVADTGLDADHACFWDASQGLPGPTVNPRQRKTLVYHDRLNQGNWDSWGHGTHVAGSVACDLNGNGRWDANGPNQSPDGMAPAARIAVSDSFDTDLPGNPVDLNELFLETYQDGARIHTNSWASCGCNEYTVHSQDVDDFLWAHPDLAIFFAAGNSGAGVATVVSPGTAKGAVTVGATERGAGADALAGFSSRGPTVDGRRKPTVTAPGVGIRSALNDGDPASFNDGVGTSSGTSMATPTAAGLGALVREYLVKGYYPSGAADAGAGLASPSAALLKAMLVNSARSMAAETAAPSDTQGWGRILLDDVLYWSGDSRRLWLVDEARGLGAPGESRTFPLRVGGAGLDLKVTLAWTDPPAATLSGPTLVNDLDLEVRGPGGELYLGNVFSGSVSTTGGAPDRINVEEGVRLPAAAAGDWLVTVRAANIPWGPQPYALVVTGDVGPRPHLGYRAHVVSDPDGDGDGQAEPGELVRVELTIGEDGGAAATGVRARLQPLVPWARVVFTDTLPMPNLAPGGQARSTAPWYLALDPDAPCGEPIRIGLALTSDQGSYEDGFALGTGGDLAWPSIRFGDSFDSLAAGSPPSPALWTRGLLGTPPVGAVLRAEADATVEPSGTLPPSPPNALYLGRTGGTTGASDSFLASRPIDLSGLDRARLRFRYWVRGLEGGGATPDRLLVEGSADGGASFPLLLYHNPDYISGMDSASFPDRRWHEVTVDLTRAGLGGARVVVRFRAVVNADEPGDAIYLDDVEVGGERIDCDPGCIPPSYLPTSFGPVCLGQPSAATALVLAEGFGGFDALWDWGDGARIAAPALGALASHSYAAAGSFAAALEASSTGLPGCGRREPLTVEVDAPPALAVEVGRPVCASDPRATFQASVLAAGAGPSDYAWDWGDGSPPEAVADPTRPVVHTYPALVASYNARLTATPTRVAGCAASWLVPVQVVASAAPSGTLGNVLRGARRGSAVWLDWAAGVLSPRTYNLHRTADKTRLVETRTVLGQEPVVAAPTDSESAGDAPPGSGGLWLYKVAPRDACTGLSVLP